MGSKPAKNFFVILIFDFLTLMVLGFREEILVSIILAYQDFKEL